MSSQHLIHRLASLTTVPAGTAAGAIAGLTSAGVPLADSLATAAVAAMGLFLVYVVIAALQGAGVLNDAPEPSGPIAVASMVVDQVRSAGAELEHRRPSAASSEGEPPARGVRHA